MIFVTLTTGFGFICYHLCSPLYINNCNYNGAMAVMQHILSNTIRVPQHTQWFPWSGNQTTMTAHYPHLTKRSILRGLLVGRTWPARATWPMRNWPTGLPSALQLPCVHNPLGCWVLVRVLGGHTRIRFCHQEGPLHAWCCHVTASKV